MKSVFQRAAQIFRGLVQRLHHTWRGYRRLRKPYQIVIAILIIGLGVWGLTLARGGAGVPPTPEGRTVTLATVGELTSSGGSVNLYGTVRSVTEAKILAQTGGVVRAVHASVGGRVSAGAVIAELENASERAAVLSAEGAYDGALAAQSAVSPVDARTAAVSVYNAAYNTLDTALQAEVDLFFGGLLPFGPRVVISTNDSLDLSEGRQALNDKMRAYQRALPDAAQRDPAVLLAEAAALTQEVFTFLNELATAANNRNSGATETQLAALSSARVRINTLLTTLATAQQTYRSQSVTTTSSIEAGVKQALGALRSAQATLERTRVRAPIMGQINFLPIRVGDYVTAIQHVATVAQNGSLEVVAYMSEDNRNLLTAGSKVNVADVYPGIVTSIAPALDPTTKQIEVRVAITEANELVNGQSVTIALPDAVPVETTINEGPLLLPLSAVKLRSGDRVVFSIDAESRLVANPVEVGEVRGDKIEILTPLPLSMQIVSDARGLAEGEAVEVVAPSVPAATTEL